MTPEPVQTPEALPPVVYPELVVSSWPFRTGVIVYEPETRVDVAEWDLSLMSDEPDLLQEFEPLLNPLRAYRGRASGILKMLAEDDLALRAALGLMESPQTRIEPLLSDDVERELDAFARRHQLRLPDLALARLPRLLTHLEEMDPAAHHSAISDWWESFERDPELEGESIFRQASGPEGSVYGRLTKGDQEAAYAMWQREVEQTPINHFSLWVALRAHWGWRLEFSDHPRPVFPIFAQLAALFPRS